MRHVPNILTSLRLFGVPLVVWCLMTEATTAAFWLFVFAGLTDAVDGAIARMFNARSRLGLWLDPIADKVLLVSLYIALGLRGDLPFWLVVLVVLRDVLIVLYVAVYVLAGALTSTPLFISKINTAAQMILVAILMARLGPGWESLMLEQAFIIVVAVTTGASGAAYLLTNRVKGRGTLDPNLPLCTFSH